jgi:hypothetical protein
VGEEGTTEVEWLALRRFRVELRSGVSEEGVDQFGSVLDPLEPVLHHRDQLVDPRTYGLKAETNVGECH